MTRSEKVHVGNSDASIVITAAIEGVTMRFILWPNRFPARRSRRVKFPWNRRDRLTGFDRVDLASYEARWKEGI